MATTSWFTYRPSPTQPTFPTPTMETTHRPRPTHTTIHITQCHTIAAVPHRQAGAAPRRSRTTKSTAFLPTTLFPRMSHHLEHTTTFSTTTRSHGPTTPPTAHSIFPRQHTTSLPMGFPQTIPHTTRSSLLQTKEVMAKRTNSHQLLQIHSRHIVAGHLQGLGHYASSSSTSTSWSTFYPQPMATQLHNHFQTTPDDIHLTPINDDLVGFFNSVPQQRLVDAVISLCNRWKAQHATTTITIDVQSTGNPIQHSHIGRHYIHHPQQRTLDIQHIPLIVQQALQSCIFQACNNYYKQIQGAGIGSQLSPALCNVAITANHLPHLSAPTQPSPAQHTLRGQPLYPAQRTIQISTPHHHTGPSRIL